MENYIIYGINRVAKDFIYFFNSLNVIGVFDDTKEVERWNGLPVISLEDVICKHGSEKIIICDFDKDAKTKNLESYGMKHGKDFLFVDDFLCKLSSGATQIPKGRKVVLWGIGRQGKKFIENYSEVDFQFFIDSSPKKTSFWGKDVVKPDEISDWNSLFIIVTPRNNTVIIEFLKKKQLCYGTDFVLAEELSYNCGDLLKQTIFDKAYYDFECDTMLNHLEILGGGETRTCCTTFVEQGIGNISDKSINSVWGNTIHKILALSVVNRTYSFCNKEMCPYFVGRSAETCGDIKGEYKQIEESPSVVAIGYDASCNLRCETCRNEIFVAKGTDLDAACKMSRRISDEIIDKCKFFIMAGNGEVFASRAYREVYRNKALNHPKYIRILSNGTLFNQDNWMDFKGEKTSKIMATFSIDAATKETYEKIRRGGNFEIVKRNMEYASYLRKKGELAYLRLNFVVQKENYKEMEKFVEWGLVLGVDEVFFTKILNWGTFTEEEFKEISMMKEDGVTPKPELEEILRRPIFDEQIVDMGTIQYANKKIDSQYFYNYYMWELERKVPNLFEKDER